MIRSVIRGVGACLPERIVSNAELASRVDTSDEWIRERTGIGQRHIAADGELTSDLAATAARRALERADLEPGRIDLIVLATSTPDNTFPATATAVQRKLGTGPCPAFDVQAVCAGFAYALATADSFLRSGLATHALVIGAETFSRILDWEDRGTCVLFGDGAGAVVLRAERQEGSATDRGILATKLGADGRHYDHLYVDGGPSSTGKVGHLRMNGREVFRHAVAELATAAEQVVAAAGLTMGDVDLLVPHQANLRIIDAVGKRLQLPAERVVVTVDRHANTSAASIPLALDHAVECGRLRPGHLVCANAMGGGFAWGAALLRW
ncbi:MAG: beta-ketoacyl-ACP synthase III [Geminicoccaceae bacterium]